MKNFSNVVFFNFKIGDRVIYKDSNIKYTVIARTQIDLSFSEIASYDSEEIRKDIQKQYLLRADTGGAIDYKVYFEDELRLAEEVKK